MESFSVDTEAFTVLFVSLPPDLQLGYNSVAFIANEELLILTAYKQVARWKVGEPHFSVSDTDRKCCSGVAPLIMRTEVYIANDSGSVELGDEYVCLTKLIG